MSPDSPQDDRRHIDEVFAVTLAEIKKDVGYIKNEVDEVKKLVDRNYVTRAEFDPIRRIVQGMVALILSSVFLALLALVIKAAK